MFRAITTKYRPNLPNIHKADFGLAVSRGAAAVARRGSFIGKGAVLMPSYVNIGAYVDEGTMVDTWATVGSARRFGKNVHLSGGVGIGGVLSRCRRIPPSSGQLFRRRALRGGRGRDHRRRIGDFDGCVHRPIDQDLRPRDGRNQLWQSAAVLGGGSGQPAIGGWAV